MTRLNADPAKHGNAREKMEAVIFIGIQGSGKSTFYAERFATTHLRINLDMLRTRHRERAIMDACLRTRQPFVVDNTNASPADRERYITAAHAAGFRTIAYFFVPDLAEALVRNRARVGRAAVPERGVLGTHKRLRPPTHSEGFDQIFEVRIDPATRFAVHPVMAASAGPGPHAALDSSRG